MNFARRLRAVEARLERIMSGGQHQQWFNRFGGGGY